MHISVPVKPGVLVKAVAAVVAPCPGALAELGLDASCIRLPLSCPKVLSSDPSSLCPISPKPAPSPPSHWAPGSTPCLPVSLAPSQMTQELCPGSVRLPLPPGTATNLARPLPSPAWAWICPDSRPQMNAGVPSSPREPCHPPPCLPFCYYCPASAWAVPSAPCPSAESPRT